MQIPIPIILQPLTQWLQYSNSDWKHISEDVPEAEWIGYVLWDVLLNLNGKVRDDFYRYILESPLNNQFNLKIFQKIGLMDDSGNEIKKEFVAVSINYIKAIARNRPSSKK